MVLLEASLKGTYFWLIVECSVAEGEPAECGDGSVRLEVEEADPEMLAGLLECVSEVKTPDTMVEASCGSIVFNGISIEGSEGVLGALKEMAEKLPGHPGLTWSVYLSLDGDLLDAGQIMLGVEACLKAGDKQGYDADAIVDAIRKSVVHELDEDYIEVVRGAPWRCLECNGLRFYLPRSGKGAIEGGPLVLDTSRLSSALTATLDSPGGPSGSPSTSR